MRWPKVSLAGMLGIILVVAATLYGAVLLGLYAWQRHIIFAGAFIPSPSFGALPASLMPTEVLTADGERLHAFWKAPRPGCGVVLTFHGNASYPEQTAARFATGAWAADGWGVLAIAYRGYPGSTGSPSEDGLIQDGEAAFAEATRRAPKAPVLLHGHSLGAGVAIAVAARQTHYAGLYLEAPFASVLALAKAQMPWVPVGWLLRDPFRSDLRVGSIHGPIVIVHGSADLMIPVDEGRRLAQAAPKGTIFEEIPADHGSVFGAWDAKAEPLFARAIGGCPAP